MMYTFLEDLEGILEDRKKNPSPNSYTSKLMQQGLDRILKKIGEEAGEVIIAAKNNDKKELLNESADLLFHLMMVLKNEGCTLKEVVDVLEARH